MNKLINMLKLIYRSVKIHKRITKLQNLQSKLLDEMKLQLDLHEKDTDLFVGTHLFKSNDYIFDYIQVQEKNIKILETKMKNLIHE
jgi:hypothetical protein